MPSSKGLLALPIRDGLLHEYDDGNFKTPVFGFEPGADFFLPFGYTHMGIVVSGSIVLTWGNRLRKVMEGDYFSVIGPARIRGNGTGISIGSKGYQGYNICGGPLEETGKLRYIDGCTDTLLVPPVRCGDACLNHLHFPPNTTQTPHTHPSVRVNVVYRGSGVCVVPEDVKREVRLEKGYAFIMQTETLHSFNTKEESMDVITFHPDSDTGMTDDDHPMLNRTVVDGVSARILDHIHTPQG